MSPQIVMYILYGVLAFIILIATLTGIRRGLNKSLYWLVVCVLFFVLAFSTMGVASKGIYNMALKDRMPSLLINVAHLDEEVANSPAILNQAFILAQIVIKIVYFFVLWLLFYLIAWILWLSVFKKLLMKPKKGTKVSSAELKKEKQEAKERAKQEKLAYKKLSPAEREKAQLAAKNKEKAAKLEAKKQKIAEKQQMKNQPKRKETKQEKEIRLAKEETMAPKRKKRRLLGGCVGLVRGIFSCFIVLCLINGIAAIFPDFNREKVSASTETNTETTIDNYFYEFIKKEVPFLDTVLDYVEVYKDSPLNKVTKLKINGVSLDIRFDDAFLSGSYKMNGKVVKLNLVNEMKQLVSIAQKACEFSQGFDFKNINFMALNETQQKLLSDILKALGNDGFLIGSIPAVIAFGMIHKDLSKTFAELGIDDKTFASVNWKKDLVSLSTIVSEVYSLGENNNLKAIDFYNLDTDKVDHILHTLADLTVIKPSLKIAGTSLLKKESFKEIIGEISSDFWDKITLKDEIVNIQEIYDNFVESGMGTIIKDEKENGGKINILKVLTSLSESGNESAKLLISNLFESVFVQEIIENVLNYYIGKIENETVREMINLDVLYGPDGTNDWKVWVNELQTVLELVKEVSDSGEIPLDKFDIQTIKNISVDTLLKSRLLNYAAKYYLVSVAKGENTLGGDIVKYIDLPENLKDVNAPAWEEQEELKKTLTAIKAIVDEIEDFNDILKSLPEMIHALDQSDLLDSNIIYYSLNKAIPSINTNVLAIPNTPSVYANGMITKEALKSVISALNAFDVKQLLTTDGTKTKFNSSIDKIMGVLTQLDDEQLNRVANSEILRATVSYNVDIYANEFIRVPNDCASEPIELLRLNGSTEENQTIRIINKNEMVNLLKALNELKDEEGNLIDFTSIDQEPEKVLNYISKESAQKILVSSSSQYSKILHASISKFIIDKSTEGAIIVPNKAYQDAEKTLIKSNELVSIIDTIKTANIDFTQLETNPMSLIDQLDLQLAENLLLTKNTTTYSCIMHATVSHYLLVPDGDQVFVIPSQIQSKEDGTDYILDTEIVNLIKIVKYDTFKDLNLDKFTFNDLTIRGVNEAKDAISDSVILRATITNYITADAQISIPKAALEENEETSYIKKSELNHLIESLYALFVDDNDPSSNPKLEELTHLSISQFELDQIDSAKGTLVTSIVIRHLFSEQAMKELGNLPEDCLDQTIFTKYNEKIISEGETLAIINALVDLQLDNFSNITIEDISLETIYSNIDSILASNFIYHTISTEITQQDVLVVPMDAMDLETQRVKKIQIKNLFQILNDLKIENMNSVQDDNFSTILNRIDDAIATKAFNSLEENGYSSILHATVSSKLNASNDLIVVPSVTSSTSCYLKDNVELIQGSELVSLIHLAKELEIDNLENLSLDTISIDKISENRQSITQSKILLATITNALEKAHLTELPVSIYDMSVLEDHQSRNEGETISYYMKDTEFNALLDSLIALKITDFNAAKNLSIASFDIQTIIDEKVTLSKSTIIRKIVTEATTSAFGDSQIELPKDALDAEQILTADEFSNVLQSIKILGIERLEDNIRIDQLTIAQLKGTNPEHPYEILDSIIIWNEISNQIKKVDTTVIVPDDCKDASNQRISKEEIKALLDGMVELGFNEIGNLQFDLENNDHLTVDSFNQKLDLLLKSKILHATLSHQITNLNNENIIIPDSIYDDPKKVYITQDELKSLFNSLKIFGVEKLTSTAFETLNQFNVATLDANINSLLKSQIIHYTISNNVLALEGTIHIPDDVKVNEQLVKSEELKHLVHSLSLVKVANLSDINVLTLFENVLDTKGDHPLKDEQIDTLFESRIIEVTSSNYVKEAFSTEKEETIFKLPQNVEVKVEENKVITIDYVHSDIDKQELINLIKSSRKLGFTDFEVVPFTLSEFLNDATMEDLQVILLSKINSYNLGIQIQEQNKPEGLFNEFLAIPDDFVPFYGEYDTGKEFKSDLYPFLESMIKIYDNPNLKNILDSLTGDSSQSNSLLTYDNDEVYKQLAEAMTNGRILLNTIPKLAEKFVANYSGTYLTKGSIQIPQDKDVTYWRGENVIDGELYKFFIAMNRIAKIDIAQPQSILDAKNAADQSDVLKNAISVSYPF